MENSNAARYLALTSFQPVANLGISAYRGDVAKWLGSGLQNRLRRFNSVRHLQISDLEILVFREN